jgi:hypothetical protein
LNKREKRIFLEEAQKTTKAPFHFRRLPDLFCGSFHQKYFTAAADV